MIISKQVTVSFESKILMWETDFPSAIVASFTGAIKAAYSVGAVCLAVALCFHAFVDINADTVVISGISFFALTVGTSRRNTFFVSWALFIIAVTWELILNFLRTITFHTVDPIAVIARVTCAVVRALYVCTIGQITTSMIAKALVNIFAQVTID